MANEYPTFCETCGNIETCVQKYNMLAETEPVEGFVIDGEIYCDECLRPDDPRYEYSGETDCPAHCSGCGVPLICDLTCEGVKYVKELITNDGGCCRELWPVLFADYLED